MSNQKFTINKINDILNNKNIPVNISTNVSNTDKDMSILRNVDDTWEDENGHIWVQKDGFRMKLDKNHEALQAIRDEIYIPKTCPKCKTVMTKWQDKKFYSLHKMCMDCVIKYEHELKLDGKYDDYAKNKIKQNALAWLKDAEAEIEVLKNSFKAEYVNEDGSIEKWEFPISPNQMKENIEKQFIEFKKEFLEKL